MRVDTGVESGSTVSPYYDSMVAKVIAHRRHPGRSPSASSSTRSAGPALHGPVTNRDQLLNILRHPAFVGRRPAHRLPRRASRAPTRSPATWRSPRRPSRWPSRPPTGPPPSCWRELPSGWRNNPAVDQVVELVLDEVPVRVAYRLGRDGHLDGRRRAARRRRSSSRRPTRSCSRSPACAATVRRRARRRPALRRRRRRPRHVHAARPATPIPTATIAAGSLVAPMPGNVLRVLVGARRRRDRRPAARRRRGDEDGAPGRGAGRRHGRDRARRRRAIRSRPASCCCRWRTSRERPPGAHRQLLGLLRRPHLGGARRWSRAGRSTCSPATGWPS